MQIKKLALMGRRRRGGAREERFFELP